MIKIYNPNRMPKWVLTLLGCFLATFPGYSQSLEEGFQDPPISSRPRAYWVLVNGNFDLSKMTEELKTFKAMGMGGVDLWDVAGWVDPNKVIPAGPPFMGDASLQAIAHGIREGHKLGLEMGLTISSSWNAGGDWVLPEDGIVGLYSSTLKVKGPAKFKAAIPFPNIPEIGESGEPMLLVKDADGLPLIYQEEGILALPAGSDFTDATEGVLDISAHFKKGILNWDIPPGQWEIVRFISTPTGQPLKRPSPNSNGRMIDHFSAKAQKNNLNFLFTKLESELGPLANSGLSYLYTDSYEANSATWTFDMKAEFLKRNHYDLTKYLPLLKDSTLYDEETRARFTYDFNKTLSDLIIENHYTLGKLLCNQKGIGFVAEAGGPGPPLHNTPFESLKALGSLTVPRGEFWFDPLRNEEQINFLQIIKGPASAAHLYGQNRVEAEAFTGTQIWQFGPGELKRSADRALCEGLNSFIYHTTPHMPPAGGYPGWVYNFGTIINPSRVWWPFSKNFHTYLARSSFLLQQGNFVGDVLYYYGDQAPNFIDHESVSNELGFGYDYDGVNTEIILDRLTVTNGMYVLPNGQTYKVLALPDQKAITPEVLEKIKSLVEQGGVVWGNAPERSHGLYNKDKKDSIVQHLSSMLWKRDKKQSFGKGYIYTRAYALKEVLKDVGVLPDVQTNLKIDVEPLNYIHRTTPDADIYFFINNGDASINLDLTLRTNKGAPEFWDPLTGERELCVMYLQSGTQTTLPLELGPGASTFIIFRGLKTKQVLKVKRNKQVVFPEFLKPLGIQQQGERWLIDVDGKYNISFADGSTKKLKVEQAVIQRAMSDQWKLQFPYGQNTPRSITLNALKSWTDFEEPGVKHFSGIASYENTFVLTSEEIKDREVFLDLGEVQKVARIYINGTRIDELWTAPYQLAITNVVKEGENRVVVEVANVLNNRLVGDAQKPESERMLHTNITKGPNPWMTPYEELTLKPSGLLGPVKVLCRKKIVLSEK